MSRHEGVSCDSCSKSNFRGKRYKCLICFDYDLCSACYENRTTTTRHTADHAMQCILTRADFDLFFAGELLPFDQPSSHAFVCPHCYKLGLSEAQLSEHVTAEHSAVGTEVICPICAALPGGDPNHVTDDLASHLSVEHRGANRDLEEPLSRNIRRIFQPVRSIPPPRSRRAQQVTGSSATSETSSAGGVISPTSYTSARENIDPIAELLSQLSGVRRAAQQQSPASTASQLQMLQQQLQFERQQVQHARERLERLPRGQPSPPQPSKEVQKVQGGDSDSETYLLDQCYVESLSRDEEASRRKERESRERFTQELMFSLLASEIQPAAQSRSRTSVHGLSDPQLPSSDSGVALRGEVVRARPADLVRDVANVGAAEGVSAECPAETLPAASDSVLLRKHTTTADTAVAFLRESEGDPNRNDTSVS